MRAEEIDALLGGEAQKLADKYTSVPLDFMDGYGWAVTQICRLFHDAEPVKHGKWLDDGQYDNFFPHHEWRCSECGEHVLEIGAPWFKYCPNCGARMDAERKEE